MEPGVLGVPVTVIDDMGVVEEVGKSRGGEMNFTQGKDARLKQLGDRVLDVGDVFKHKERNKVGDEKEQSGGEEKKQPGSEVE